MTEAGRKLLQFDAVSVGEASANWRADGRLGYLFGLSVHESLEGDEPVIRLVGNPEYGASAPPIEIVVP